MTEHEPTQPRAAADDPDDVGVGLRRPGGLSYLHLPATDVRAAALFYAAVFDWSVSGVDDARPSFVDTTGHVAGAWMRDQQVSTQPGILPYVYVADVDAIADRIVAAGGQLVTAPYPEGNLRVATFRDPSGNVLGLWQLT